MTTREVTVETTATEEVAICDGCGREVGDDGVVYSETVDVDEVPPSALEGIESLADWACEKGQDADSLHFCSEECVDAVRATAGVREPRERSPTQTLRSALNRLWEPTGHYDDEELHPDAGLSVCIGMAFSILLPVIGPVMCLWMGIDGEGDEYWQAGLVGCSIYLAIALAVMVV